MSADGWVFAFPALQPFEPGAARALEAAWPRAARVVRACDEVLRREAGMSMLPAWYGRLGQGAVLDCRLCLPLTLAYQVALFDRLVEAGEHPAAVVGMSAGESAAAYAAGMLSLEDATRVAVHTGRVVERHQGWQRIASLHAPADAVEALIREDRATLDVAMSISGRLTVVSGEAGAVARALERATLEGIGHTQVGFAFGAHNTHMEACRAPLLHALRGLRPRAARCPVASSAAGGWIETAAEAGPELWWRHVSARVHFTETLDALWAAGYRRFVEMGRRSLYTAELARRGAVMRAASDAPLAMA